MVLRIRPKVFGWLLFFYSVPSKPVNNRVRIWRKLLKAGALQFKGAVYLLPFQDEKEEFFQWLVSDVSAVGGEAAYVSVTVIETMRDNEIIALFNQQREKEYRPLAKAVEECETRLNSIRKGSSAKNLRAVNKQLDKLTKTFEEIRRTDFFSSQEGTALQKRIEALAKALKRLVSEKPADQKPAVISLYRPEDYQGKIWATRKRPFVDRMASAWLINRFIDGKAVFRFMDENEIRSSGEGPVTFDIRGGEFTHSGDMCTFEVLMKSFGLRDKTLKKMAEIIHDLDMKDDKFSAIEAKGMENILEGIRRTAKNDHDALEKGMTVFEMLYASKG